MTQQLPPSPIDGLEVESVDDYGRTWFVPIFTRVVAASNWNKDKPRERHQWRLASTPDYWECPMLDLVAGQHYKLQLTTIVKEGTTYRDIKKARLSTDKEIPAQQPAQAANPPQTGSQSRPDRPVGDFNTGMAFNQAATLVAALITSHPQARDWLDYDYVIEEILIMRERLYHEVLMWPIGAPDEEPGTEHPDGEPDTSQHTPVGAMPEEPEMPPVTVAEEPEPDDLF